MNFLEQNMNQIVLGDSYKLIKQIPDKSIDLIITDPPYGIKRDKGFNGFGTSKKGSSKYQGGWDNEIPPKWFFKEMERVSKHMIIFGGNYYASKLPDSTHWDVWDKKGQLSFKNDFSDCELIYTNLKGNCNKYTVIQQGFINDGDERIHPTQKPERLIRMLLNDYAKEGFVIGDFFSGSGTVAAVCKQEGYDFIAIEKDIEFHQKSIDRLNGIRSDGQTSIFTDFDDL